MIELEYVRDPGLPRLAWLAKMSRGSSRVRVLHGPWVEARPDFFFEGAWPAPFEEAGFPEADIVLGSGARRDGGSLLFTTASHTLERLHLLRVGDDLLVSNSLAFCLAQAGDAPDPTYPFYLQDLIGVTRGVRRAPRRLPTRAGRVLELVYYANLRIGPDLGVERLEKTPPPEHEDFAGYYRWLVGTACALGDNAASGRRQHHFRPVATLSSGYDSPACAVIASGAGCREGLTIANAREAAYEGVDDSGAEIGRLLGLEVHEFEQSAYRSLAGLPEAEFMAGGTGGGDVVMASMEEKLSGALLYTGFLGDTVWGLADPDPVHSRELVFRYAAGIGLHEYRLRVGFIHFPVPQSHQRSHPSIRRISVSEEMAPWTLGSDYDRPIARRIVESAGIPRELFGCAKKAVTQPIFADEDVSQHLTPSSRASFERFLGKVRRVGRLRRARFDAMVRLHRLNRGLVSRLQRRFRLPPSHALVRVWVSDHYSRPWSKAFFLFHWGVDELLDRYGAGRSG